MSKEFINGIRVKSPANKYEIARISISKKDLAELSQQFDGEWLNGIIRQAKSGKYYIEKNTFKPDNNQKSKEPF